MPDASRVSWRWLPRGAPERAIRTSRLRLPSAGRTLGRTPRWTFWPRRWCVHERPGDPRRDARPSTLVMVGVQRWWQRGARRHRCCRGDHRFCVTLTVQSWHGQTTHIALERRVDPAGDRQLRGGAGSQGTAVPERLGAANSFAGLHLAGQLPLRLPEVCGSARRAAAHRGSSRHATLEHWRSGATRRPRAAQHRRLTPRRPWHEA
jgi:hypothetical protein